MCKGNLQKKSLQKVMIDRAWGELIQSRMTRNMTSRKTFAVISSSQLQISKDSILSAQWQPMRWATFVSPSDRWL